MKTNKHRILNKFTGRNMETIYISLDEMVNLIDKYYITEAVSEEEYKAIWKTVTGGWTRVKNLWSKDGKYEMHVSRYNMVSIFNMKDYNWIWIHEIETDKFFEYRALFYGKFKKKVKEKIKAEKKSGV